MCFARRCHAKCRRPCGFFCDSVIFPFNSYLLKVTGAASSSAPFASSEGGPRARPGLGGDGRTSRKKRKKKRKDDIRSAAATAGEGGPQSVHIMVTCYAAYTEVRAQSMVGGLREGCARGTTQCEGSVLRVGQRPLTQTDSLSLLH